MKIFHIILFLLSLTGIYLIPQVGIRTDHIIIYSILVIYLLSFFIFRKKILLNTHIVIIILFLLTIIIVGVISLDVASEEFNTYRSIAQIENFFQPIAIIIITSMGINFYKRKFTTLEILSSVLILYLFFLTMNVLLAIYMLYFGSGDYITYIAGPPGVSGITINERVLAAGRSGGVFGQPFDAGLAYSIGLLCWVYLYDRRDNIKYIYFFYTSLPIILTGSFFSGSKVVQFLGVIFFLFYLIISKNLINFLLDFKNILFIALGALIFYIIIAYWSGEILLFRTLQYFILNRLFLI